MKKTDILTPTTPDTAGRNLDAEPDFDIFSCDSGWSKDFEIKKNPKKISKNDTFDFDFNVRVLMPTKDTPEDQLNELNAKIRDLVYEEETNHLIKKNNFWHDFKFLFLKDSLLGYNKAYINR